ncbi:MAG TPA: hypothetical protein VG963_03805, partial [Polyangiaceae bacterium]|nr:hypothetical protein [Polyangiaceae bacterium]
IFTRIDPFESFLKEGLDRLGKQPIVPQLECVRPLDDGRYRAYFGYENQNGISVEIPFSKQRNDFPADTAGDRPSTFGPGEHAWVFGVTFGSRDQLRYQLVPKHGPATVLRVNRQSTACAADDPFAACAGNCEASLAAECADPALTFERCESECVQTGQQFAACQPEWNQYLECVAGVGPDESNWFCAPDFVPQPVVPDCNDALNAAIVACGF